MIRDLGKMAGKRYDVLVIGGGITGAFVAWDCSLRGLSAAIIDKGDFGAATSAATSKLIHGGLRYLKTLEMGLVRESLQERRIMEIIAPPPGVPVAVRLSGIWLGKERPSCCSFSHGLL